MLVDISAKGSLDKLVNGLREFGEKCSQMSEMYTYFEKFLVKELSNLLNPNYEPLDPCDYQWALIDEETLPIKNMLLLPEDLTITCSCS